MEEQIKRAVRDLNISYVFFWVLPAFLLGAGEFDLLPVGALVDNPQATYYMETAGILLTALCVPLALKLFSLVLKKKIDLLTIPLALKRYVQWSMVRLGLLEVSIVDPWIRSKVPSKNKAVLSLQLELRNHTDIEQKGVLKGIIQPGNIEFTEDLVIEAGKQRTFLLDDSKFSQFIIQNPALWWPNGYGQLPKGQGQTD